MLPGLHNIIQLGALLNVWKVRCCGVDESKCRVVDSSGLALEISSQGPSGSTDKHEPLFQEESAHYYYY